MVLKLKGHPLSPHVTRVILILREKKIPFEFVEVNLGSGEHKKEEYISKHPFGQIPAIEDDGFHLAESRAIARYLEAKYPENGPKLIPTDLEENALFEEAASYEVHHFQPHAGVALVEKKYKAMFNLGRPDEEVYQKAIEKLDATLDVYEKILAQRQYIAGRELTLVDLFHIPVGTVLGEIGYNGLTDLKRPNVARWWRHIADRPEWFAIQRGEIRSNA